MAKRRMTNYLRQVATRALLHHASETKATAHVWVERDLADQVMNLWLGEDKDLYGVIVKAETQARSWFKKNQYLHVNAGGWTLQLDFYDRDETARYTVYGNGFDGAYLSGSKIWVPMPNFIDQERLNLEDEALIARIQAHAQERKTLNEEAVTLLAKINSTMASYTTVETLLADIPELATLAPELFKSAEPVTAIVAPVKSLLCDISAFRGEEREGCPCEAPAEPERVALAA